MQVIKKYWVAFVFLGLVAVSTIFIYQKLNPKELPDYLIQGVGFVDGDLLNLNTKYAGRVEKLDVDTGDEVKKGETVAVLSSKEYVAKKETLNSQIESLKKEIEILDKMIPNAIQKAELSIEVNQKQVAELDSNIASLKKVIEQDERDYKRTLKLYNQNSAKLRDKEMAKLKLDTDKDKLKSLLEKKAQLLLAIKVAKLNFSDAEVNLKKIDVLKSNIKTLKSQINEINIVINELNITSPIDGYVDTKVANKGEVLGAGSPIVTLINPKTLYLKMYVSTLSNGKIKIGDKAVLFLDAYPNKPIMAKVTHISKSAEFTPKEVAVKSDRISRVYEVYLKPLKFNPLLKLGIPATGVILINDNYHLPESLNELPVL